MRQEDQNSTRHESRFWEQLSILLTVIGLWFALPATITLIQRIVDNAGSLAPAVQSTVTMIKIVLDTCLFGLYILGLLLLMVIGSTAVFTAQAARLTGDALQKARKRKGIWGFIKDLFSWLHWKKWWDLFKEYIFGKAPEPVHHIVFKVRKRNRNF